MVDRSDGQDGVGGSRVVDPACPPWCSGHDDAWQPWRVDRWGAKFRPHASTVSSVGGVGVEVTCEESAGVGLLPPLVVVWTPDGGEVPLTPLEARRLAATLEAAADAVDGGRGVGALD